MPPAAVTASSRCRMAAIVSRIAGTGVASSGSSSVLTGPTLVARAGVALGDEPAHSRLARRGEQRVGALGAQPVGPGEAAVEVLEVAQAGQRGRLMDDR